MVGRGSWGIGIIKWKGRISSKKEKNTNKLVLSLCKYEKVFCNEGNVDLQLAAQNILRERKRQYYACTNHSDFKGQTYCVHLQKIFI